MKIVSIGGGPAGLYFSILMKKQDPSHDIVVIERNRPYDTFGWGVVFSDETLGGFEKADKETYDRILDEFAYWPDIDTFYKGECIRSTGHGFACRSSTGCSSNCSVRQLLKSKGVTKVSPSISACTTVS